MPIKSGIGNIFDTKVEALVNPVNTVGVMGKGLALEFKKRFPINYSYYRFDCDNNRMEIGKMLIYSGSDLVAPLKYIINFPTKNHWRNNSKVEYINSGLTDLVKMINFTEIKSIAIPPLGCGNGGLDWLVVKPLIESYLGMLPGVDVLLYDPI